MAKITKAQQRASDKYKRLHCTQKMVVFIKEDEKELITLYDKYLEEQGLTFSKECKRLILDDCIRNNRVPKELADILINKWDG